MRASWTTRKISKAVLNNAERNVVLKALRANGITPPKPGYEVRALGGLVVNHGRVSAHRKSLGDTGWQVIEIDESAIAPFVKREDY